MIIFLKFWTSTGYFSNSTRSSVSSSWFSLFIVTTCPWPLTCRVVVGSIFCSLGYGKNFHGVISSLGWPGILAYPVCCIFTTLSMEVSYLIQWKRKELIRKTKVWFSPAWTNFRNNHFLHYNYTTKPWRLRSHAKWTLNHQTTHTITHTKSRIGFSCFMKVSFKDFHEATPPQSLVPSLHQILR